MTQPFATSGQAFDAWWDANAKQYSADACHMSEYHMAKVAWDAARSETVTPLDVWVTQDDKGFALYKSEESAKSHVYSLPVSTRGGINIYKLRVYE